MHQQPDQPVPPRLLRATFGLYLLIALIICLSACKTTNDPPPTVVYKEVQVPVAVGCTVAVPSRVQPLQERVPADHWQQLPPGAKAAAVEAQAGRRLNYEDQLRASVAGCRPAEAH